MLADLSKSRMRGKRDALAEALVDDFGGHHGDVTRRIMDHIAFLDASSEEFTEQIASRMVVIREVRVAENTCRSV